MMFLRTFMMTLMLFFFAVRCQAMTSESDSGADSVLSELSTEGGPSNHDSASQPSHDSAQRAWLEQLLEGDIFWAESERKRAEQTKGDQGSRRLIPASTGS